ncbi:hypothetical protein VV11_023755, partial [Trichodesmium erythraeum 21-75]|nr:hypothetical protein [Trichodesmium erythraeum 21-75]
LIVRIESKTGKICGRWGYLMSIVLGLYEVAIASTDSVLAFNGSKTSMCCKALLFQLRGIYNYHSFP